MSKSKRKSVPKPQEKAHVRAHKFVAFLKAHLQSGGVPLTRFCDECGISRQFLYKVLSGKQSPTLTWANKVARHIGAELVVLQKSQSPKHAKAKPRKRKRKLTPQG